MTRSRCTHVHRTGLWSSEDGENDVGVNADYKVKGVYGTVCPVQRRGKGSTCRHQLPRCSVFRGRRERLKSRRSGRESNKGGVRS